MTEEYSVRAYNSHSDFKKNESKTSKIQHDKVQECYINSDTTLPTLEELCSKLNVTLNKSNMYAISPLIKEGFTIPKQNIDIQEELICDKFKPVLCSIHFYEYQSTREEYDNAAKFSTKNTNDSKIIIKSLKDSLRKIVTKCNFTNSPNESFLIYIVNANHASTSTSLYNLMKKYCCPTIFVEIILSTYNSEHSNMELKGTSSSPRNPNNIEDDKLNGGSRLRLPAYLKIREFSSSFIYLRVINPDVTMNEENEENEIYKVVSESLIFDLSRHSNYIKFKLPYQFCCSERLVQSKKKQAKQASKEFKLLENVQLNAFAGVNVTRQYCQNTFKSTKTIPLLLPSDERKLRYLKNYMNKMMSTYVKHEVPEVSVLTKPLPEPVENERLKIRHWLEQFK